MLLELQRGPLRQRCSHGSARVIGNSTLSSRLRTGLHPIGQSLSGAGGRWHGKRASATNCRQRLAPRTAPTEGSTQELQGLGGLQEDVDVKAILSDPHLEGDPLQFLKVTEAYWSVRHPVFAGTALPLSNAGRKPSLPRCTIPVRCVVASSSRAVEQPRTATAQMVTARLVQALKKARDQPSRKGPAVVSKRYRAVGRPEFDVCVAGGTLGIFIALALQVLTAGQRSECVLSVIAKP